VRQQQAQRATPAPQPRLTPTTTRGGTPPRAQPAAGTAQITTSFNSSVTDGYIMVRVGGDVIAHENLYQETGRFLLKRRVPRNVNVSREITPKSADVDIWVIIPSMNIQEHRTLRGNFLPGSSHHLVVSFDPQNKTFNYRMN